MRQWSDSASPVAPNATLGVSPEIGALPRNTKTMLNKIIPSRALSVALAITAATCVAAPAQALQLSISPPVRVGGAVPGVGCQLTDESAPHMAVDPTNSNHLAIAYSLGDTHNFAQDPVNPMQETEYTAQVVANSFDGGKTWTRTALPGMTICTGGDNGTIGDPYIAIGSAGRMVTTGGWISYDPLPSATHSDARLFVTHSSNSGATFSAPVEPEHTMNPDGNQRGPVLFDPQFPSRVYVAFERLHYLNEGPASVITGGYFAGLGGSVSVARSDDGGATFPHPVTAYSVDRGYEIVTIGLLRSGSTLVLIAAITTDADWVNSRFLKGPQAPQNLIALRSTDGGLTFEKSDIGIDSDGEGIPSATAAPNGTLYVTWNNSATKGIVVARSTDAGKTWTGADAPAFVTSNGAMQASIAARADGTVGVFYYAFAPGAPSIITPYIAVSADGTTGWTPVRLADPFDLSKLTGGSNDGRDPGPGPFQDVVALPDGFGVPVTLGDQQNVPPGEEELFYIVRVKR